MGRKKSVKAKTVELGIEGVKLTNLDIMRDERGEVRHMLKSTDPTFEQFGEIYFSTVGENAVKAWHAHKEMTLYYTCVFGSVIVRLVDMRPDSRTLGAQLRVRLDDAEPNYKLLVIPPMVWNGFRVNVSPSLKEPFSIVANCATHVHKSDEIIRLPASYFGAVWGPHDVCG